MAHARQPQDHLQQLVDRKDAPVREVIISTPDPEAIAKAVRDFLRIRLSRRQRDSSSD